MLSKKKHATPPASAASGFRIFVRSSYTSKYNFAVANYNAVSKKQKSVMRDGFVLLYRSVVAVVWIIAVACAILCMFTSYLLGGTIVLSVLYIAVSLYNLYVHFANRDLLNSPRLLRAKVAGPDGCDHEWVLVPLNSSSANERLAAVDQSALDYVRKQYAKSNENEIECMVYTKRYADLYPSLPKELLLHLIGFSGAIVLAIVVREYLSIF